jgi:cell division protein FtsB
LAAKFSNRFLRGIDTKKNYTGNKDAGRNVFILVVLFVPVFFYIWLHSQSMMMNYEVNALTKTHESLKAENRILELKLQRLVSSENIEKVAKEQYGFKRAGNGEIYVIEKERPFIRKIVDGIISSMRNENGAKL